MYKVFLSKTSFVLAAVAAAFCVSQQAHADQIHYSFKIAAGASSPVINMPISNSPILVSCTQTTGGNVGTGQATLVRSTTDGYLVWAGYDNSGATHGYNTAHIVYCDFREQVDIEMGSATGILVKNPTSSAQTVELMLTY